MSTLLVENIRHEDASDIAIVLSSNGTLGIGTVGTARNDPLTVKGLNNIAKFESSAAAVELRINTPTVDKVGLTTGTNDNFFINVGSGDRLYIKNNGNVGIDTPSPNEKLSVKGNIELYNDEQDGYIWFHDAGTRSWTIGSQQTSGNFVLTNTVNIGSNEQLVVTGAGNVGIGTTIPTDKLHVNGNIKIENGSLRLANLATPPGNPSAGDMYYDTANGTVVNYDGSQWVTMSNKFTATGGTEGTFTVGSTTYKFHKFTSSGTFTADATGSIDILVVAGGGGGGGGRHASGAGAGGLIYQAGFSVNPGNYTITVGAGGAGGGTTSGASTNGGNSTAFGLTSIGGGAGGNHGNTPLVEQGQNGGSGGGSAHTAGLPPGSGTAGQGNSASRAVPNRAACPSGGGAGGPGIAGSGGEDDATGSGDTGGPGLQYNMDGNNHYYAGGGGGSASPNAGPGDSWIGGDGGIGGGGGGASACDGGGGRGGYGGGSAANTGGNGAFGIANGTSHGGAGGANTGGGGGGAGGWSSYGNGNGGTGGSGVVIIRYII